MFVQLDRSRQQNRHCKTAVAAIAASDIRLKRSFTRLCLAANDVSGVPKDGW